MPNFQPLSPAQAAQLLAQGEIVAFPTETVYGLGADAANPQAIAKVYALKGRPLDHPSIVHLSAPEEMEEWARAIPEAAWCLARHFWPGPMTLILPKRPQVLPQVTGGQDSVGLRLPAHPLTRQLIAALGRGIIGPSANRFGHISPTSALHVAQEFGESLPFILDGGPCQVGVESTIIDFSGERPLIVRPGMLNAHILSDFLGFPIEYGQGVRAPGTLKKHYAPDSPTSIWTLEELQELLPQVEEPLALLAIHPQALPLSNRVRTWTMPSDPQTYARDLYAALRWADSLHCPKIWIEAVPSGEEWQAVGDRLRRAAAR